MHKQIRNIYQVYDPQEAISKQIYNFFSNEIV